MNNQDKISEIQQQVLDAMAMSTPLDIVGSGSKAFLGRATNAQRIAVGAHRGIVSYDPRNDSPADWQDYRKRRGLQRATWHFLTGDAVSTRVLARQLDLDFWIYHEHIVHDFRIVLFDAHWNVIGEVDWSSVDRLPEILRQSVVMTRP